MIKMIWILAITMSHLVYAETDPAIHIFKTNCSSCHLDDGVGMKSLSVPAIAGLPRWYVSDQIRKFRSGERGSEAGDISGHLMRSSTTNLNEREIAFLGRFIQNLSPVRDRTSFTGNVENGKLLYEQNCISCHKEQAKGDKSKRVPPLHFQLDWYLINQMEKFDHGQRVHSKGDTIHLDFKKEAQDLAAYLSQLKVKK